MERPVTELACLALLAGLAVTWPCCAAEAEGAASAVEKGEALEEQAAGEGAPAAATPITADEAAAVDPEGDAPLEDPLTCLARTIYWEAKGEDIAAMEAVANVVMNRLADDRFPDTVCGVVTEGDEQGPCQFSWWCDGNPIEAAEADQHEIAMDVTRRALNQELEDRTDGALFFHGAGANPDWAADYVETVTLGGHVFYRPDGETGE
jgi:spore germination cell wall hydrolase CwlJ-like protein